MASDKDDTARHVPTPNTPQSVARLLESETTEDLAAQPQQPREVPKRPGLPSTTSAEELKATIQDLQSVSLQYLRLLPWFPPDSPVRIRLKKVFSPPFSYLARLMAKSLHSRGVLASNLVYDLAVLFWKWVVNLFFREIRPRGAHKIPREGACIFVGAPHHNQFIDPLMLVSEARLQAGRRVSFITAEASMNRRKFVGAAARTMHSIPVVRGQDMKKAGKGLVYMKEGDDDHLYGLNSAFTSQIQLRYTIQLPKSLNYAGTEVSEIINDTSVKLKKPFKDDIIEVLRAAGRRLKNAEEAAAFQEQPKSGIQKEGVEYKVMPYVDQTRMYASVYKKLQAGGCIGIFPEGGSHDRTDLLPLKAGVAIMALGALAATPGLKVAIVPVGLSYFHAHRFRSRAVVEFGSPLYIPPEVVEQFNKGGQDKRDAIAKVLDLIFDGLKSVTVLAPDYETLMLIQATRRLYRPAGQSLGLGQVVSLNRRFIIGYERYKDEPRVKALKAKVLEYNKRLSYMGLRDHQVESVDRGFGKSLLLIIYRSLLVTAWGLVALPGVILNAPMFIAATIISRKKAADALAASTVKIQARDVVATWKILVSLGLSPIVYAIYGTIAVLLSFKYGLPLRYKLWIPVFLTIAIPSIGYSALKFGEVGMDIYKSLRPLAVSLWPGNSKEITNLRNMRAELSQELSDLVEEFGPKVFEDFRSNRIVATSSTRTRKASGSKEGLLNAPLEWLDDTLFGWSKSSKPALGSREGTRKSRSSSQATSEAGSSYASDNEEGDAADYDTVLGVERSLSVQSAEGRPRRKSYQDLQAAKAGTEGTSSATSTAREELAGEGEIRHR